MSEIDTAIFPVAGLGTRFLPATKAVPKEILTLVDRPLIQYAVDEAREAGIENFIFVTARGKSALEDYFDDAPELEEALRAKGKDELLRVLEDTCMESGRISYVRQHRALGLGHAVHCAHRLVGNKPLAVLLPDDVIVGETGCMKQMVDAHREVGGTMVATMEVPRDRVSSYGVLDVEEDMGALLRARALVEKPKVGNEPSRHAVIGRYILDPNVMTTLGTLEPGAGGEIQLTDAIAAQISDGAGPVHGYRFAGTRYDCGSKAGFLQATVALALGRDDLAGEFGDFLDTQVSGPGERRLAG